jgi:hypothetical protein
MKNKPDPALLRPSNLSSEIGKKVPKSRETIPLRSDRIRLRSTSGHKSPQHVVILCVLWFIFVF